MDIRHRSRAVGYVFAATGAILFSTKSIIVKLSYFAGADAVLIQTLRMLIALPIYMAIGLYSIVTLRRSGEQTPGRGALLRAAGLGLLGYWVSSYLDLKGLESISAQLERLILFTYPFFVVLLGAAFFGQTLSWRVLAACAVSYAGLAVIFAPNLSAGSVSISGALLVLASAITFAAYQVLAKKLVTMMGARIFTCVAMTAAALASLIQFATLHGVHASVYSPYVLLLGFLFAVAGTVLPSFFLNAALQSISARANAAIGTLSPIITIVLAFAVLGEPLTSTSVVGGLLVMLGVAWFSFMDYRSA